jgi:protease stability complex PrcB-like protein
MIRAGTVVLLLLLACGCSADDGPEPSADDPSEAPRDLRVGRISAGAAGQGPEEPRVIVAASAAALSEAIGAEVSDSGEGTYLAAYWGEKPTGGYSLEVGSARLEGNRATVRLILEEPPREAVVTQALTYPYAVAVVRGLDPGGMDFSLTDQSGRALGWPVRLVGG